MGLLSSAVKNIAREINIETQGRIVANAPNHLPGFYGSPASKIASVGVGGAKMFKDAIIQEFGHPKASKLFSETGISKATQNIVKRETKVLDQLTKKKNLTNEETKRKNEASKILTGQLGYNDLVTSQLGKRSTISEVYRPEAYLGEGSFSLPEFVNVKNTYKPWMLEDIFNQKDMEKAYSIIEPAWKLKGKGADAQMYIKNPTAMGAGRHIHDINYKAKKVKAAGKVFKNRKGREFETNEQMQKALKKAKVDFTVDEEGSVWLQESLKSSGYVEGGVNVVSKVDRKGNITSIMTDEHDLFGVKPIGGKRAISVVPPYTRNYLNKKPTEKQEVLNKAYRLEKNKQKRVREKEIQQYGVIPKGTSAEGLSRNQRSAADVIANMEASGLDPADYLKWMLRWGALGGSGYGLFGGENK